MNMNSGGGGGGEHIIEKDAAAARLCDSASFVMKRKNFVHQILIQSKNLDIIVIIGINVNKIRIIQNDYDFPDDNCKVC
ncbi:hypothetical protein DERF_013312 [Dermatophagoides farinae]|uniref:Uncharacterized protein n=1 Tax=Dermatophagoides farinae TaxID=6954 RepID=A0A922HM24_DERFA|nr:hypothetical protein DERF_013312 [Dermatophagoides farinae]